MTIMAGVGDTMGGNGQKDNDPLIMEHWASSDMRLVA